VHFLRKHQTWHTLCSPNDFVDIVPSHIGDLYDNFYTTFVSYLSPRVKHGFKLKVLIKETTLFSFEAKFPSYHHMYLQNFT